jgi:hypothetical protein
MDLLTRLQVIASNFRLNGANDAQLAIAACVLIDEKNEVVFDARDIAASLARMQAPRYLGRFGNAGVIEAKGLHRTANPGDFAFLTESVGGMVHFAGNGEYYRHVAGGFDRFNVAVPNQPEWLSKYLIRGIEFNFINSAGAYLSGYYADPENQGFIDVSHVGFPDPEIYRLDVVIVPDPTVPGTWTELIYKTDTPPTDGNVDEYTYDPDDDTSGDYVDNGKVGVATGEIPTHFQPALGFYD